MASNQECIEGGFDLECALCFEKYESTKFELNKLQCGHEVCGICLKEVQKFKSCPTCNAVIESDFDLQTHLDSSSIEISSDVSSESETGITNKEIPIDMPSKTEVEPLSIEIPINTQAESKKELLSKEILADKLSESKEENSSLEISIDSLSESMRKTLSISILKDASSESKKEISSMKDLKDTLSDCKMETPNKETPMSLEIPTDMLSQSTNKLLQKSPEYLPARVSKLYSIRGSLEDKSNNSFESTEYLTESEDCTENLFEIEIEANTSDIDSKMFSCYKKEIKPKFTLGDYPSKEEFIQEIINWISNVKQMYAINLEWYTSGVFWGKLTYDEGRIYIHSFSDILPKNPPQFVMLKDLKKCMTIKNFRTFIDIGDYHLICTMLTSSPETMSFIKLCSGEDGESYKGLNSTVKLHENRSGGVYVLKKELPNIIENTYHFLQSLPFRVKQTLNDDKLIVMKGVICEIITSPNVPHTEREEFWNAVIASVSSLKKELPHSSPTPAYSVKRCGLIILHPIQEDMSAFST